MSTLPEDLQRVLEMACNLYQRGLAKDPERLREVAAALEPFGVALYDFKKFRVGWSSESGEQLSGYYAEQLAKYPAVAERFERLGLTRQGRDTLAGCVTFPVPDERGKLLGLVGVRLGEGEPAASGTQRLLPGQDASDWLFAIDKAVYGIRDHGLAVVAGSVLSFFTLYSILGAIGLEVAVALSGPRLEAAGVERLLKLGAAEVFCLGEAAPGTRALCEANEAGLHELAPVLSPEEALGRLEEIAGLTRRAQVRWMLEQAVAARRDAMQKGSR
jgi:hypothetical protein